MTMMMGRRTQYLYKGMIRFGGKEKRYPYRIGRKGVIGRRRKKIEERD